MRSGFLLTVVVAVSLAAAPAAADWPEDFGMCFGGFIVAEGGLDEVAPGDGLLIAGMISLIQPDGVVPWNPEFYEYTMYTAGLVATEIVVEGYVDVIACEGGRLEIRENAGTPADWDDPHPISIPTRARSIRYLDRPRSWSTTGARSARPMESSFHQDSTYLLKASLEPAATRRYVPPPGRASRRSTS